MKKKYISLFFCLVFVLTLCFTTQSIAMAQESDEEKIYCEIDENTDFADDTIMVVLTNKVSLSAKKYTAADFAEISCIEVVDLTEELWQRVINHQHSVDCNPERETKAETFNRILKLTISNSGKTNVVDDIIKLEKRNDVKAAEPNYIIASAATSPDDMLIEKQWGLDKINLFDAWDIETGNANVLVGVVDTGIDISHPDLVNRVNTSLSKDFSSESDKYENNPFEDNDGHGTHVAGIIGAEPNNGTGVAGVCWNVSLVSLKVTNGDSTYYRDKVAQAIQYAALNDISILNISHGLGYSYSLKESVENYPGLVVCSAGNNDVDIDQAGNYKYPASYTYDNVLTVGASTSSDEKADFSNYGKENVDIFAPGEKIASTIPLNDEYYDGYCYMSGTSMAAPFVAGVAALVLSHNDTLTAKEIKDVILNNCDKVGALNGYCVTNGRLNAYKALNNSHNYQCSYKNNTTHTKYCKCGYSVDMGHLFVDHICVECGYYSGKHYYNSSYTWLNYRKHQAMCMCGASTSQAHAVSSDAFDFGSSYSTCLLCGGPADRGIVKDDATSKIHLVTGNGSYVLPNGVIVLVDEDIGAYLNGTLTFISGNAN
ncbi:MAG: S8 family serine peptidase [Clostridiales bacterium]|nr:S8 family serine peptidase [Clostridiales bacterium]